MANVTYLLGAGASANTIPVVNNIVPRLQEVRGYLRTIYHDIDKASIPSFYPNILINQRNLLISVLQDMDWLYEVSSNFQTVDTLAKKLYLTNERSELFRLKRALILYLAIEQVLYIPSTSKPNYNFKKTKEFRYDSFLASIMTKGDDGKLIMNPGIKILSWNYDSQLELAMQVYISRQIRTLKEEYKIYPNEKSLNELNSVNVPLNQFLTVKLNGSAIWLNPNLDKTRDSIFDAYTTGVNQFEILGKLLEEYNLVFNRNDGKDLLNESLKHFNFSWESDKRFTDKYSAYNEHIKLAERIAEETEYLVIIGYSFPIFNREMDKRIIDNMRKIKKIYIQDPNAEDILSTLKNGFNIFNIYNKRMYNENPGLAVEHGQLPIQIDKNTNQFTIPFDL